jgi:hypothetical protein
MAEQQSMYDRGWQSFLYSRVIDRPMAFNYPTRDRHSEEQEAEFLLGWSDAEKNAQLELELSFNLGAELSG